MYWQEDPQDTPQRTSPDEVVDVSFPVAGATLPVDHAYALLAGLLEVLPWLAEEPAAGVHEIYVAASQNGWYRPDEQSGGLLYLSRRTRMALRVPRGRLSDLDALRGARLEVDGHPLTVGEPTVRALQPLPTLFARHVASRPDEEEEAFVESAAQELRGLGIRPRKLLCGKVASLRTPAGALVTRSLMVADLDRDESLLLQSRGLGAERRLGCGIFVPHKGIGPVRRPDAG